MCNKRVKMRIASYFEHDLNYSILAMWPKEEIIKRKRK